MSDQALPSPPYIVVSQDQWPEIAEAIERGRDHPLAIDGVPIVVAQAEAERP